MERTSISIDLVSGSKIRVTGVPRSVDDIVTKLVNFKDGHHWNTWIMIEGDETTNLNFNSRLIHNIILWKDSVTAIITEEK